MAFPDPPDLLEHAVAKDPALVPLPERMRPRTLDEVVGQAHLVGHDGLLRRLVASRRLPSLVLWGPPGSGKTTLARLLAGAIGARFEILSATQAGVKDLRATIERARVHRRDRRQPTVVFVDEIHRFNKAQQDALLPHVEAGVCILLGATTENPSFEINAALLSRCRVVELRPLEDADLVRLLRRALQDRERGLGGQGVVASDETLESLARVAQGDARRALRTLELAVSLVPKGRSELDEPLVTQALERPDLHHDKAGEAHFNVVSALIKSMRASDPDATAYWLARMLEAGEDPMYVARRLVIFASEDVGNADPQGLVVAHAAAQAVHLVGMPEAVLPLTQAATYLALAEKSNSALRTYAAARKLVRQHGALPVPLEIRNAVTQMMRAAKYGAGYKYPHDLRYGVAGDHTSYLPQKLRDSAGGPPIFAAGRLGWEAGAAEALARRREDARENEPPRRPSKGRSTVDESEEPPDPSSGA
ncbi:MAG: replication-associated recombination protein A [Myxococcales bacterium FL481]|nr:MAG: replication-associated recombination protein A [Myxococcales bacterium FL481]